MAISNSNKPVTSQRQVGATYGERRQLVNGNINTENQIQRPRDFFKQSEIRPVAQFSSNAQYVGGNIVIPHKVIEEGHLPKPTISDKTRLTFLDKIISGYGDNRPPQTTRPTSKTLVKSASKPTKS